MRVGRILTVSTFTGTEIPFHLTKWESFCTLNSMTRENRAKITVFTLICIGPNPTANCRKHCRVECSGLFSILSTGILKPLRS